MQQNLTQKPSAKSAAVGLLEPELETTWSLIINHQSLINSSELWTKGAYHKAAEKPRTSLVCFPLEDPVAFRIEADGAATLCVKGQYIKEEQMFVAFSSLAAFSSWLDMYRLPGLRSKKPTAAVTFRTGIRAICCYRICTGEREDQRGRREMFRVGVFEKQGISTLQKDPNIIFVSW